ncbi:MAG: hypothetical protein MRJ65_02130 [Candidatus Brocadiaceae bacterium]|nr:hypothetical protein [Candidatus Brocadiaceae bacterium]
MTVYGGGVKRPQKTLKFLCDRISASGTLLCAPLQRALVCIVFLRAMPCASLSVCATIKTGERKWPARKKQKPKSGATKNARALKEKTALPVDATIERE